MNISGKTRLVILTVYPVLAAALASAAFAQKMGPLVAAPAPPNARDEALVASRALRLSADLERAPLQTLRAAAEGARDQVDALVAWNAAGKLPTRNGFSRPLPAASTVHLTPADLGRGAAAPFRAGFLADAAPGWLAWGTHVKVQGAYRLRLHLTGVQLPEGSRMWVHGAGETPREFGLELRAPAGDLWTPSVGGESLLFEIQMPLAAAAAVAAASADAEAAGPARTALRALPPIPGIVSGEATFTVGEVMEIFRLDAGGRISAAAAAQRPPAAAGAPRQSSSQLFATEAPSTPVADETLRSFQAQDSTACLLDSSCEGNADLPNIGILRRGMAALQFNDTCPGGVGTCAFLCSASLLNDTHSDGIPYLLTANHCFSTQASATSLEAFWDYFTSSCNHNFLVPDESSVPRSNGSTLLTGVDDSSGSDFTLVQLHSVPAGRTFLGWDANASSVRTNTTLFRLSHPAPNGQSLPQAYSQSSVNTSTDCGTGVLPAPTFIYHTLTRGATAGGSSGSPVMLADGSVVGQLNGLCGTNVNDNCDTINNDQVDGAFAVTFNQIAQFLAPAAPQPCTPDAFTLCLNAGRFKVTATFRSNTGQTGNARVVKLTDDTGYFWFFSSSNVEAVLKVLNGCGVTHHYWVFAGGLTNVRVVITVTDSTTGAMRTYTNPLNIQFQPIQDTAAFSTCP
ncbi:MAG TPA: trypsin-like peptidase domain-containing protein [Thermoanaerobaculia bacterium]|nr:trypsin-like peptidase domain-containing protein [Thermoanaerobaculia bacterium]